ncbi:uncharacterized protein B0H18DRAFT_1013964 [Fomitopsis serialis]|uniref:uncharacterized protein n=1 Tax=Fomitopsis serialis TaxID=139415 RepID=UPI0020078C64|nr:uncharacterized protein B0H18DRAFT_1013964 [Neoantrodia serialis]KAH9923898.1 hypothetical protein B0H18DRAFT_1013964 [Neoantrodia serialis]
MSLTSQSSTRIPPPLKSATMRKWPRASLGLSALTISSRAPPTPGPLPEADQGQITEIAMAIAEQLATMTNASQPVVTDEPLMLASLEPARVVSLHTWLRDRYEWDDPNRMMFDEDVTAQDLARDIVTAREETGAAEEEDDFEESFKTAAEFMASPSIWVSDTRGTIRTVHAATPRINTTMETFPSIALRLSPERGYETPLRSAPVPVTASKYLSGQATVDIGMAPYESWTGKRSRKHSRASKMIFGVLGLAALASPLSPTMNNALSPTHDPRAPCSAHTPIFSPWLQSLRVHSVDPLTSPWLPNRRGSDGLWAFPQSPRGIRC